MNRGLREKNGAKPCINNVDEAMLKYYRVFAKQIKSLLPELQLSDFYYPSDFYYLLQLVQAWQHMSYTGTLNK